MQIFGFQFCTLKYMLECLIFRVMMKKEIRKKKILRDGKEETIITEDVHMVQDEEEPEELRDSVQMIIDQFMEGTSLDIDSSYGQHK